MPNAPAAPPRRPALHAFRDLVAAVSERMRPDQTRERRIPMRLAPLMCPQGRVQPSTITHLPVGERHHPAVRPVFRTDPVQFLQQAIGGPPAAARCHHDQGCRRGSGDALVAVHVHVPAACDRQPLPESDQSAHVRGRRQPLAPGRPHRIVKRHSGHPPAVAAPERHRRLVARIENGDHVAGTAEAGSLDRAQARYGHPKGRQAVRRHWSGRPGSNRRHSAWEADVLPLNYARANTSIHPTLALKVSTAPPTVKDLRCGPRRTCPQHPQRTGENRLPVWNARVPYAILIWCPFPGQSLLGTAHGRLRPHRSADDRREVGQVRRPRFHARRQPAGMGQAAQAGYAVVQHGDPLQPCVPGLLHRVEPDQRPAAVSIAAGS